MSAPISPYLPAAAADGSAPAVAAYHPSPADFNPAKCAARDTAKATHEDRRWTPFVYMAFQCKNDPVSGTDLCTKCIRHEAKFAAATTAEEQRNSLWHGRVNEDLNTLPAVSHMAGSVWFHERAKWKGEPKAKTAKQAGHHEKRQLVKDVDLMHFVRGELELEIERLIADNQITGQQLRDCLCMLRGLPTGAKSAGKFDTKEKLCVEIRRLMVVARHVVGGGGAGPVMEVREAAAAAEPVVEPIAMDGELKLIAGAMYVVKDGNAYAYDEVAEKAGVFVGRLSEDGESVHLPLPLLLPPAPRDPLAEMAAALAVAMGRIATLEAAAAERKAMLTQLLAAL